MSVAEIYEERAAFSFEVFPPKTDVGMEKLCGEGGVLEKLYTLNPDYISCTYGAGGTNVGKNLEVLDQDQKKTANAPRSRISPASAIPRLISRKSSRPISITALTICSRCGETFPSAGRARTATFTMRPSL